MISKTSTYFLALAMFTSETAFGLSLEAKPARDINNLVRSRSTFDKLAQVQSRAFAKQDLTGAKLDIKDPNKILASGNNGVKGNVTNKAVIGNAFSGFEKGTGNGGSGGSCTPSCSSQGSEPSSPSCPSWVSWQRG